MKNQGGIVHVLNGAPSARGRLSPVLASRGFAVERWPSAREFLARKRRRSPSCLVLDLETPKTNGLELQRQLSLTGRACPVIFLSGRGDVSLAVRAMKNGAHDFLTKPVNERNLLAAVDEALRESRSALKDDGSRKRVESILSRLSPRELAVYKQVVGGRLNKQIARALGITEQTVKVHRARVMRKTRAASLAALVRLSQRDDLNRNASKGRSA